MKSLQLTILTLVTFAPLLIPAQNTADVPPCAQKVAGTSIASTGCQLTDIACICGNQRFIQSFLPTIEKACSEEDYQKTLTFAQSFCAAASISLTLPTASTSAAAPNSTGSAAATTSASTQQSTATPSLDPTRPSDNANSASSVTAILGGMGIVALWAALGLGKEMM